MEHLFLIATIAGTEVAISSDCVESVVTIGEIIKVPKSDPLVAGLIALRSRVLTLIDCQYAITGQRAELSNGRLAVIANINGHAYALLVETVKDVVPILSDAIKPASKLEPRWTGIVSDVVEIEGRVMMHLAPEMLLSPGQALAA